MTASGLARAGPTTGRIFSTHPTQEKEGGFLLFLQCHRNAFKTESGPEFIEGL